MHVTQSRKVLGGTLELSGSLAGCDSGGLNAAASEKCCATNEAFYVCGVIGYG